MTAPLLSLDSVSVAFRGEQGSREVVSRASFEIAPGEIVGVVGESGSGKSVTALAIMRLLGAQGALTHGRIAFEGHDLSALREAEMRRIRGRKIAMIFQEPMTSLNPLLRVGFQIEEVLRTHLGLSGRPLRERVVRLLDEVGIPAAATRCDDHPHSFSGGMRQRVMIAMAMACEPQLLIADEPTTALDVTIQAQILQLMKQLRTQRGSAILLITHDMGVIARMADRVVVMYAGEVVEIASARDLFARPAHPYARLLLEAIPTTRTKSARLPAIPGQMPAPDRLPSGCRFRTRCPSAIAECSEQRQDLSAFGAQRTVRCWRARELAGEVGT